MKDVCLTSPPEPFNDDGTWRTDVFYNTLGTDYVQIALNAARSADPAAKLYINDYNIENPGAKSTAMQNLVKTLKAASVPLDGIGLQSHFIVGSVPSTSTLVSNMNAFVALGVEVAITELDIRMTLPSTPALLAQQKTDYTTVISACQAVDEIHMLGGSYKSRSASRSHACSARHSAVTERHPYHTDTDFTDTDTHFQDRI